MPLPLSASWTVTVCVKGAAQSQRKEFGSTLTGGFFSSIMNCTCKNEWTEYMHVDPEGAHYESLCFYMKKNDTFIHTGESGRQLYAKQ
jgi:hypothetical protein